MRHHPSTQHRTANSRKPPTKHEAPSRQQHRSRMRHHPSTQHRTVNSQQPPTPPPHTHTKHEAPSRQQPAASSTHRVSKLGDAGKAHGQTDAGGREGLQVAPQLHNRQHTAGHLPQGRGFGKTTNTQNQSTSTQSKKGVREDNKHTKPKYFNAKARRGFGKTTNTQNQSTTTQKQEGVREDNKHIKPKYFNAKATHTAPGIKTTTHKSHKKKEPMLPRPPPPSPPPPPARKGVREDNKHIKPKYFNAKATHTAPGTKTSTHKSQKKKEPM